MLAGMSVVRGLRAAGPTDGTAAADQVAAHGPRIGSGGASPLGVPTARVLFEPLRSPASWERSLGRANA